MSYHIEGDGGFKNLPERILVREDGYMAAYKFESEPIVDYWYVPEAENAKLKEQVKTLDRIAKGNLVSAADHERLLEAENDRLRELSKYAILCSEGDVRCEACPYHDKTAEPHIICMMRKAARELGVEVAL